MRAPARARALSCLLVWSITAAGARPEHGIPIEIKLWDTGRTPLSHMVDVTNEFGLKVLAEHNYLNENNIAFSPYGLMGILVALYEGVEGESSYQIQRAIQIPWNRNVMRIGFRDIHRTLKTYFVPEEGFLAGLALNNENVTFNDSYRKILRFYGFDLENDQLPPLPANNDSNQSPTLSSAPTDGAATTQATATPTLQSTAAREDLSTAPAREETTTNPNAETFNDIDLRMPSTAPTIEISSSALNIGDTAVSGTIDNTFTTTNNDLSTLATGDNLATEIATERLQSFVTETITPPMIFNYTEAMTSTFYLSTSSSSDTVNEGSEKLSNQESTTGFTSAYTNIGQITSDITVLPLFPSTTQVSETEPIGQPTNTSETSFANDISTPDSIDSTVTQPPERRKKSIVNFIFTSPPYIDDDLLYRAFDIHVPESNVQHAPGGDHMFLANGLKSVQVPYMQYDAVLEHAFLPHLQAAALRVPLDSARYYLLALLPARARPAALPRLLARLARRSDLRDVYAALRPTRVRALLPSFTVKGHVALTADLQKLGIREVFEPRQRDFAPMTGARAVHVRSVEQAVSVALRKYAPDDRNSTRYANQHPVHFSATYPFLYFVMDASIHVALMAGKMVDPLNSRIL